MIIEIMDYSGNKKTIDIEENAELSITIKSGDEILTYTDTKGNEWTADSSSDRTMDFYDGTYTLDTNAEWFEKWKNRKSSYEGMEIAYGWEV